MFVGMHLKPGNNIYIFACKQISLLIEWMSEDSIFFVNVEHILLCSRRKILPKTCFWYCLFFLFGSLGEEKKMKKIQLIPL